MFILYSPSDIFCLSLFIMACSTFVNAEEGKNVIVIGAGMSGVTAARELTNNGFSVTVLEARDRIGGRIFTNKNAFDNPTGCEVECGASWIHAAATGHEVYELAKKLGLELVETDYEKIDAYFATGNKTFNFMKYVKYESDFYKLLEKVDDDITAGKIGVNTNVEEYLLSKGFNYKTDMIKSLIVSTELEADYGTPGNELSALLFWEVEEYDEHRGQELVVKPGYLDIIEKLIDGVESNEQKLTIIKNQHVVSVEVQGRKAIVKTKNNHNYDADYVVVTVPLGVLKEDPKKFGISSSAKIDALKRIKMGTLNKIILQFSEVFWDKTNHFLQYVDSDLTQQGFAGSWVNFYPLTKQPFLMGFAGGSSAPELEAMTDEAVLAIAAEKLAKLTSKTPEFVRGKIVKFYITRWKADAYSRGSYSFPTVGSKQSDYNALAEPECPIYFAGEHTYFKYLGSVHAAYLSGKKAASDIMAKKCNWTQPAAQDSTEASTPKNTANLNNSLEFLTLLVCSLFTFLLTLLKSI